MDFFIRTLREFRWPEFSARIPRLSQNRRPIFRKLHGPLAGTALILLGLVLASWAYSTTADSSLKDWKDSHPPSRELWKLALLKQGLSEVTAATEQHTIARTFTGGADLRPRIWIEATRGWAIVQDPAAQDGAPLICARHSAGQEVSKHSASVAPQWVPIGEGWDAMTSMMAASPFQMEAATHKSTVSRLDSREIRY